MKYLPLAVFAALGVALSGCAMSSDVMDMGNGTYMISSHASFIRGGATEANSVAYQDATKYCRQRDSRLHAIVLNQQEREVFYNSSVGGSWYGSGGSIGGGTFAAGNVNLRFRCGA